jgi:hypothetical protein
LLAASFVLIVLLLENSVLYARLVEAHENERRKTAELLAVNRSRCVLPFGATTFAAAARGGRLRAHAGGDLRGRARRGGTPASRRGAREQPADGATVDALLDFARPGATAWTRPVEPRRPRQSGHDELRAGCAGRSIEFAAGKLGSAG